MQRIVIQQLTQWKESEDRKPLILNGARQVGKTWALREFARQKYEKEAYILCRKNEQLTQLFQKDFNVERILRGLRAISGVDITPEDTLIILDEVQEIPEAIESLKYFYENAPQYHIAVAGSLLGISLHKGISYPVGKVDTLDMYPMNFAEFMLAKGEGMALEVLDNQEFDVVNTLHQKYVELLRQYFYVGGMPEVVQKYIDTGALGEVRRLQNEILNGYEMDFSKHAPAVQVPRLRMLFRSIPSQLFKENKKFIYGIVKEGARAKDFEIALEWLIDAGLVCKVPRCKKVEMPLKIFEDVAAFKLFMVDIGLLGALAGTDAASILINTDLYSTYKGGMAEQFVFQQMKSVGVRPIYYYSADNSRLEIDFLIQHDGNLIPIEVKGGENVRSNSLSELLKSRDDLHAFRYSLLPYIQQSNLTNYPLYAAHSIRCVKE